MSEQTHGIQAQAQAAEGSGEDQRPGCEVGAGGLASGRAASVSESPRLETADQRRSAAGPAETIAEQIIRNAIYDRTIDRGGMMLVDGREVYYRDMLAAFGLPKVDGWRPSRYILSGHLAT